MQVSYYTTFEKNVFFKKPTIDNQAFMIKKVEKKIDFARK